MRVLCFYKKPQKKIFEIYKLKNPNPDTRWSLIKKTYHTPSRTVSKTKRYTYSQKDRMKQLSKERET